MQPRIIIFGGAFDPVHHGHLFVAESARLTAKAETVVFLPTRNPHHRGPLVASAVDRLAMLRLAIAGDASFAIDDSDLEPGATGYTVDVLPKVIARRPGTSASFLVGEDALLGAPWHRFADLTAMVESFMVAPRDDDERPLNEFLRSLAPEVRAKIRRLEQPIVSASATVIRDALHEGRNVRYLLPEVVRRYIAREGLYQDLQPMMHAS